MNHLFDKIKPKENKFIVLLEEMAKTIADVSELIIDCVQVTSREDAEKYYRQIKELEHAADGIQNDIFNELNNTFITPFDREDINNISATMDDIVDLICGCSKRIMLYHPKQLPPPALEQAKLLAKAAAAVQNAVGELETFKKRPEKIKEYCAEIEHIEKQADEVYEHFLIDLFDNEKDAIEIIKLRDILHELEKAADAAQAVGKAIKTVIIKYS
jgi:predicted phosphate transport protein (TIGR00153 family)